ncbi:MULTISPECIES: hypothetical protein [unclassified Streptomyces]|uniref:hypothetical protein n=1 Tax=unclassified Streptomyces TaxID=2593676 RepID=UPI0038152784
MGITSRAGLASVMACMATAAAVAPAAATPTVPVVVPLGYMNPVLPFDAPTMNAAFPVPLVMPGVPTPPRYVRGKLLPKNMVPSIPIESALPTTDIGAPLPAPLGSGPLGNAALASPGSVLHAATPGADIGAPLTAPNPERRGMPAFTTPAAGVIAPVVQGDPAATASL